MRCEDTDTEREIGKGGGGVDTENPEAGTKGKAEERQPLQHPGADEGLMMWM